MKLGFVQLLITSVASGFAVVDHQFMFCIVWVNMIESARDAKATQEWVSEDPDQGCDSAVYMMMRYL